MSIIYCDTGEAYTLPSKSVLERLEELNSHALSESEFREYLALMKKVSPDKT